MIQPSRLRLSLRPFTLSAEPVLLFFFGQTRQPRRLKSDVPTNLTVGKGERRTGCGTAFTEFRKERRKQRISISFFFPKTIETVTCADLSLQIKKIARGAFFSPLFPALFLRPGNLERDLVKLLLFLRHDLPVSLFLRGRMVDDNEVPPLTWFGSLPCSIRP